VKRSGNKAKKEAIRREKRLVARCVKGDKKAWDEFVDTYKNLVYSVIIRTFQFVGHDNPEEATDDIFQDIFALILKDKCAKLRRFKWKNGCSLASWLLIISKSRTFDYLRKVFSRKKIMTPLSEKSGDEGSAAQDIARSDQSFLEGLEREERTALFKKALKKLPKNDLLLVDLIYFRAFSAERAAAILGKATSAVYMQKKRIIEKLTNIIKKYEGAT